MASKISSDSMKRKIEELGRKLREAEESGKSHQNLCSGLQEMVQHAVVGIYQTTRKGEFLLANPKMAHMLGYDSPETILESVHNISRIFDDPKDRDRFQLEISKNGFIEDFDIKLKRQDGRALWCNIGGRKVEKSPGQIVYEGFAVDITKRTIALQALHESEIRFRALVDQAAETFLMHDYDGNLLEVNQYACKTLGYSREELLTKRMTDIVVSQRPEQQQKTEFWETIQPGEATVFESEHLTKDGTLVPVEVRLGRLDIGETRVLLSLGRDITDQRRKKEELETAFEEIKTLKNQLEAENLHLREEIKLRYQHNKIVGESDVIKKALNLAEKVAGQDTCVLVLGETGTGKELLAQTIHDISPRGSRPMVTVNCAALPASLIESELFGREKGAFTGALTRRAGRFEAANGSTIFLDEIGDLPMELQAKLLRVLQEGQFERLGSTETINVNVRTIAATNCDLEQLVREGKFRKDLFFRLNVFPITLPSLKDRKEDIPLMAWAFVREFCQSMGKQISSISARSMKQLTGYNWPGNVRELRNIIERAMIMTDGVTLRLDAIKSRADDDSTNLTLAEYEKNYIVRVLKSVGWQVSGNNGAARILGLKPTTLEARMKKLDIRRPDREKKKP